MKKIHILENALRCLLDEGRNAEKAKQKTIAVMKSYLSQNGIQDRQLESMAMEYENSFKDWLFHANMPDSIIRLEPIMANVAMQLGFTPQNRSTEELYRLKDITNYIIVNYNKEDFPIALNKLTLDNTTFERLNEVFGNAIDASKGAWKPSNDSKPKPHYTVKRLDTFEEAHKYYPYTQDICYLGGENTWINYTDGGRNAVYVLLRDGWQNVPAEHGENTPYDDYGKSMVFVIVRPDGDIAYTNTRWNHNTNGNGPIDVDQSFTDNMNDVSDMLQTDYRNILKPYTDEELIVKGLITIPMLRQWIAEGKDILQMCKNEQLSDKLYKCYIDRSQFIIYNNETYEITPAKGDGLRYVNDFRDNIAVIMNNNDECSFINTNGKQICGWYENVKSFSEGFAAVEEDEQWSFINMKGQRICGWYYYVISFRYGFAAVQRENEKWSLINTDGKLICGWYENVDRFYNGFAKVQREDNKWSFINTQGKQIGDWYKDVSPFKNGFAKVQREDGKWSFINTQGQQMNKLYRSVENFYNGLAKVQREDGKWSFVNEREEQFKDWYKSVGEFENGYTWVENDDYKFSLINDKGEQICGWYKGIDIFYEGYARIERDDGKYSFINTKGQRMFRWFDAANNFRNGLAYVVLNHYTYCIDTKGNLYDPKTKQPISVQNESYMRLSNLITEALHTSIRDYLLYN